MIREVFLLFIGVPLIVLGFIVWKKEKIYLLSSKYKRNMKEENMKEFTESLGKTYIMTGVCLSLIFASGFINNEIYEAMAGVILIALQSIIAIKNARVLKKFNVGI